MLEDAQTRDEDAELAEIQKTLPEDLEIVETMSATALPGPAVSLAWTGGDGKMLDRGGRVSRFKDKFKGFM